MKVLVLGSGSKEHAIIWKLLASEKYRDLDITCIPGNQALKKIVDCVPELDLTDVDRILEIAIARNINLTIVGEPELFSQGIVDKFRLAGKAICGPTKAASEIESSNSLAKDLLIKYNIPCAKYACFDNLNLAYAYLTSAKFPLVIRADKKFNHEIPVAIAEDYKQARRVVKEFFKQKFLSRDVPKVIIEEYIEGHEFTINLISDGDRALSLLPVQSYRDLNESEVYSDKGAFAPTPILNDASMSKIRHDIINPLVEALKKEGRAYTGLLALDVTLDLNDGIKPKLIQCRSTLADSDAQVVLPLLDEDLYEILSSSAKEDLSYYKDGFHKYLGSALSVNIISGDDRPGLQSMSNNELIETLNEHLEKFYGVIEGIPLIFYGTKSANKTRKVAEAEIFGATAIAENLLDAQILAYKLADSLAVPAKSYIKDIGDQGMV